MFAQSIVAFISGIHSSKMSKSPIFCVNSLAMPRSQTEGRTTTLPQWGSRPVNVLERNVVECRLPLRHRPQGVHANQSHWDWLREAESFHVTHKELVTFLLGCDLEEWPLPWTTFALDAIPRELPQKLSGHNPRVFEPPFLRKVTSANAPSELYRYAAVSKSHRLVSPEVKPPSPPKIAQTELGWTDPVATYSKHAKEELAFLLTPYHSLDAYGQSRIRWHQDSCPISRVTDFFLFIEQHAFFLMLIKLAATLALQNPVALSADLREAALGEHTVCPSQLKDAFHRGIKELKMPVDFADYADDVRSYMAELLESRRQCLAKPFLAHLLHPGLSPVMHLRLLLRLQLLLLLRVHLHPGRSHHPRHWSWKQWTECPFFLPDLLVVCFLDFCCSFFVVCLSFLTSLSRSYGYWEMPPLHQQGRRVSNELLSIMVSPPTRGKVVTLYNGDLADKIWLPSPLVKQNWLHQVKIFNKEWTSQLWFQRWPMRVVTLRYPMIMQQRYTWSGMDQRQHGELVTLVLKRYGCIRCPGEEPSSHINLLLRSQLIA